ncbi:hypothetical protein M2396_000294 [Pseudomonas sp. BIGb0278]|uniref:hypothetical protein n=1 Tax=Pseudomonas sp. BIGb0278 TaxID=2940607 RepID=UPI00216700B7|nr:hypothetical protein [Pseudomonas sp. BIGb0278]MCS4282029.1 hypothetical protein [Pseudomonas sp. BIGb0278]
MPTTWIEIVDTTVKIGLGAVVTGIATLLNNKLSHTKSAEKDSLHRSVAVLESVTLSIEEMTHTLLKHWSFIVDVARNSEKGVEASEEKLKHISGLRSEVYHLFKGLTNGEGRLLLIGCVDQQKKLRNYGSIISEYHRYTSPNNALASSAELESWRTKILDAREQLYSALNKAYQGAK